MISTNTIPEIVITIGNDGAALLGFATGVVFFIFLVFLIFDR